MHHPGFIAARAVETKDKQAEKALKIVGLLPSAKEERAHTDHSPRNVLRHATAMPKMSGG
jgi:hypothetical protein